MDCTPQIKIRLTTHLWSSTTRAANILISSWSLIKRERADVVMENSTNLYIPVKIKTRFEFFDGFGFAELIPTLIVAVISGIVAFAVHGVTGGTTTPILIVLISVAATAISLAKGSHNLSVIDQIYQFARFSRGQKTYKYRRLNEWGGD